MKLFRCLAGWALLLAALVPSGASAASFNFFSTAGLGPTGGAGDVGPANLYPSSLAVSGLSGTLTKVTVTILNFDSGRPDDVDMLLVGPEADMVMLMSDACGEAQGFLDNVWTFDDEAAAQLPDSGPCVTKQAGFFKPSNFAGGVPEPDQFGAGGSIVPPYSSTLSTFAGTEPNGPWELYVRDDSAGVNGFEIGGWALTLNVEPPTPPVVPPTVAPTTTQPATTTTAAAPPATAGTAKTGKRARALDRCKSKKTKVKRAKCRTKARKLPV
jgi:hypothetical protein